MRTVAELWQMLCDAQCRIDLQHKELDWIYFLKTKTVKFETKNKTWIPRPRMCKWSLETSRD